MTIWILPESDRKGWAVCLFWLQGGNQDDAPTGGKHDSISQSPYSAKLNPNCHMNYS